MFKNNYKVIVSSKTAECVYRKKIVLTKQIFRPASFGFRVGKSAHQAIFYVKTT
jgi:retron-type reverse transcriptase